MGLINHVVPLADLEKETVNWCVCYQHTSFLMSLMPGSSIRTNDKGALLQPFLYLQTVEFNAG